MGKISNVLKIGVVASGIALSSLFNKADAQQQVHNLWFGDPLVYQEYQGTPDTLSASLGGMPVEVTQNGNIDTIYTNSEGVIGIVTGVEENNNISPVKYNIKLHYNQNNLVFEHGLQDTKIEIYSYLVQRIKTVENNYWDFSNEHNIKVATGVYLYRLYHKNNLIGVGTLDYVRGANYLGSRFNTMGLESRVQEQINKLRKSNSVNEINLNTDTPIRIRTLANIEDYYNYDSTSASVDSLPSQIALFPSSSKLGFVHPTFTSALEFDKWFTYSDGTYGHEILLIDYPSDQPLKVFLDRENMPCDSYAQGFDSSRVDWERAMSFNYQGGGLQDSIRLSEEQLIEEVLSPIDTGVVYDYSTNFSHQIINWHYPQPFPPNPPVIGPAGKTTIYINNGLCGGVLAIRTANNTEWKHKFFHPNDGNRTNPDLSDNDQRVKPYIGKLLKTNRALQPFFKKGLPRLGAFRGN